MNAFTKFIIIGLIINILNTSLINAQNVDQSFKPVIKGFPDISSIMVLPDGKFFIGGIISSIGNTPSKSVIKFNSDGTVDTTFQTSIYLSNPGKITSFTVDADNKVLIGAQQFMLNGKEHIVRLNADGTFDNTFSCSLKEISHIECIANGKYIVTANNNLFRINNNGSIDFSFSAYSEPFGLYTGSFKVLDNEKILCAIHYTSLVYGCSFGKLVRLNSDGSLDSEFDSGTCEDTTGTDKLIYDIEIQTDGNILIGGNFKFYKGKIAKGIIRLKSNGEIDSSFNCSISEIFDRSGVTDLALCKENKIMLCGGCLEVPFSNKVLRLYDDGSMDSSFNIANIKIPISTQFYFPSTYFPKMGVYDGRTYVIGAHLGFNEIKSFGILALDSVGQMINSFQPEIGGNPIVNTVLRQGDGKLIIGGEFTQVDSFYINNIVRFNIDGSIDTTFLKNIGIGPDFEVKSIVQQSDSKLILGGVFSLVNNNYTGLLTRLNPDGSLDGSFKANIEKMFEGEGINKIIVDSADQIIIGGVFGIVNGEERNSFAVLNPDGTLNSSISPDLLMSDYFIKISDMVYQSDKRLVLGGERITNTYNLYGFTTRLNKDGTIDDSFHKYVSNYSIKSLAVIQDDKIVAGDLNIRYNESAHICQFNKNGEIIDSTTISFSPPFENSAEICTIEYPGGDQLIIGGSFRTVNGMDKPTLTKVSLNGDVDEFFKYDIDGKVTKFIREDSTHIFVVGTFNRIGNVYDVFSVARIDINFPNSPTNLNGEVSKKKSSNSSEINLKWTDQSTNETGFSLEKSIDNKNFQKCTLISSNSDSYVDNDVSSNTKYYYRVKAYNINGGSSYSNVIEVLFNPTLLKRIEIDNEIQVLSNPGDGNIVLKFNSISDSRLKLKIFNISGVCVYNKEIEVDRNGFQYPINIMKESEGVYFVNISSNKLIKTIKYIKRF
ncbi:MAG: T9SS type A sorting domain-containing protein [Bacteroidales bacterium]